MKGNKDKMKLDEKFINSDELSSFYEWSKISSEKL